MTAILKVDTIQDTSGNNIINESSNTITIGAAGDTTNIVGTLQNNGAAVAVANTPAFSAYAGSDQNGLTDDTYTKLAMNTEFYDTTYNVSNYRFTPTVAGYYIIGVMFRIDSGDDGTDTRALYKNGSQLFYVSESVDSTTASTINATIELDDNDYVELYAKADVDGGGTWNLNQDGTTANNRCFWFGYKLIG